MVPSELPKFILYWLGPEFIRDHPKEWGRDKDRQPYSELPEVQPINFLVQPKDPPSEWFARFSSYDYMIRVVARMRRMLPKGRRRLTEVSSVLTRIELNDALCAIVLHSQQFFFIELRDKVRSRSLAAMPFIDDHGVIRVGGRLRHADLSFQDTQYCCRSLLFYLR